MARVSFTLFYIFVHILCNELQLTPVAPPVLRSGLETGREGGMARPVAACGAWSGGERVTAHRRGPRRWSSGQSERKRLCVFLVISRSKSATH